MLVNSSLCLQYSQMHLESHSRGDASYEHRPRSRERDDDEPQRLIIVSVEWTFAPAHNAAARSLTPCFLARFDAVRTANNRCQNDTFPSDHVPGCLMLITDGTRSVFPRSLPPQPYRVSLLEFVFISFSFLFLGKATSFG
jgi:hypothetical protein